MSLKDHVQRISSIQFELSDTFQLNPVQSQTQKMDGSLI